MYIYVFACGLPSKMCSQWEGCGSMEGLRSMKP